MADTAGPDEDDEVLVRGMKQGHPEALSATLEQYGHRVKGYLRKRFSGWLREPEIDAVLNLAACNLWESIGTYDPAESTLLGWFIRIAHNAALDEARRQRRHAAAELTSEPEFPPVKVCERAEGAKETTTERRLRLMRHVIMNELRGNRRVVAMANLVAGGTADRKQLAAELGIPVTNVDITWSQTRKRIRERVLQLEQEENSRAGKS